MDDLQNRECDIGWGAVNAHDMYIIYQPTTFGSLSASMESISAYF